MSDEPQQDDRGKRRRRRRKRKPGEAGGEAGPQQGAAPPDGPRPQGAAGPRPQGGDEDARRKRRRRPRDSGPGAGGAPEAGRGARPTSGVPAATDPARGRRRGRGRDGHDRDNTRKSNVQLTDAGGSMPRVPVQAAPTAPHQVDDVDAGWDDAPAPRETRDPIAGLRSDPSISYGDAGDDGAEPPPIQLAADLPEDPGPDEFDAITATVDADERIDRSNKVRNVVAVKFASAGKLYLFDGGDQSYRAGEQVLVESERGPRMATVAIDAVRSPQKQLKKILRRPDKNDVRAIERNEDKATEMLRAARERARELKMDVKVFRAELAHTGKRVRIYFTSEQRIDFRDLVRDLTRTLHARVEMRQTGVRDQAKMVGGIGSCGLELCCTTWLPEFVPVSIKNAKDQGLVLNPTKVSGQCGRLKCCLVYEQELYSEMRKGLPKMGKRVVTPDGEGRVVEVDVLRQRLRISLGHGEFKVYAANEVERLFPAQQTAKGGALRAPAPAANETVPDSDPDNGGQPT